MKISPLNKAAIILASVVLLCPRGGFASQKVVLAGTVRDASSAERLAAANVRLLGTSRGTITNAQGEYTLAVEQGPYLIVFSMLGYHPDTVQVTLTGAEIRDVYLRPSEIILPEVVVTSEDPAIEIIRRAIANKRLWIDRLASYEMDAFTRQTLFRDTSIASITESFTKGYWQQGDTLREVIKQRRQTANIETKFNFASVGRILNFNEERVQFIGYRFVGPTAADAFDYYDYRLLRTRSRHGYDVYEINMIPRSRTVPLFRGTVSIANESYALVGVDIEPNEAFLIPFLKEKRLRYRQEFGLYENAFWMPIDIRIDGAFTVSIPGFSIPRIVLNQTSVISNYALNVSIPDSVFAKPRLTIDSSATTFDSTLWVTSSVLPLSVQERKAYNTLDSTQTLDVQFRPGGITGRIGGGSSVAEFAVKYLDIAFNRVEGLRLGGLFELKDLLPFATVKAGFAYGTADRQTKYLLGGTLFTSAKRSYGVGAEVYRSLANRPDYGYYGPLVNSFTALLAKNDYREYYSAKGWKGFVVATPVSVLKAEVAFVAESQTSVGSMTDFSILYPSRDYRPNPLIVEGNLRSLRLDARIGGEAVPLDLAVQNSVELSVERSSPSFASSQFDFLRYNAVGSVSVTTFGQDFLFKPMLRMRLAAGTSSGTLPPQRLFDLESQSSGLGPFGVMRGMHVKEFSGTGYVALNVEHNFRSIPFLAAGIPFLYENNIELLAEGGTARTWNSGGLPVSTTGGWYYEAGFGISRVFEIIRADFTWRLSAPRRFVFTLGVASIF